MKIYRVAIYNNHGGSKTHTNRPLAYLTYFTSHACIHNVVAESGHRAKALAIKEHHDLEHSDFDPYCSGCPGLGSRV